MPSVVHWTQAVVVGASAGTSPAGIALMNYMGPEDGYDGFPGKPGLDGGQGPAGNQGPAGPALFMTAMDGDDGQDGFPGQRGNDGSPGIGTQGPAGPAIFMTAMDGDDGQDGFPGQRGIDGVGIDGIQGPPGPALFMTAQDGDDGDSFWVPNLPTLPAGNVSNIQVHGAGDVFFGEDTLVWITATKRLGVGTGAPAAQVDISDTGTSSTRGLTISQHNDNTTAPKLELRKSRGTKAIPATLNPGDSPGNFGFRAWNGSFYSDCVIFLSSVGTLSGINYPSQLTFQLNDGVAGTKDRLKLTALGNVVLFGSGDLLATSAVDGFLYITSCNGLPTGTPTVESAKVPLVVDANALRLKMHVGGAWRDVLPDYRIAGQPGWDGEDGNDGFPGQRGLDGGAGAPGPAGPALFMTALDGDDGYDGRPGIAGPTGPAGSSTVSMARTFLLMGA